MAGFGNQYDAGFGMNAGVDADLHLNAQAGAGVGGYYGAPYAGAGVSSTGSILVLFILLVIIARSLL
jgi:hypothetical protein